MTDNLYRRRSTRKRLKHENDKKIIHDRYTQRIIDDQEIYDTENKEFESYTNGWYIENIF